MLQSLRTQKKNPFIHFWFFFDKKMTYGIVWGSLLFFLAQPIHFPKSKLEIREVFGSLETKYQFYFFRTQNQASIWLWFRCFGLVICLPRRQRYLYMHCSKCSWWSHKFCHRQNRRLEPPQKSMFFFCFFSVHFLQSKSQIICFFLN